MRREDLLVYAITDRAWTGEYTLIQQVEQALQGGATFLQLREKNATEEEMKALAIEIKKLCEEYKVPFVLDDNVALAKELDVDGVHVGQSDMSPVEARKLLGPDKIIGVTAKTVEQALKAQEEGADYLGVGAVFPTNSKKDAIEITHDRLKEIVDAVDIPVVAIGGVSRENVSELKGSNVAGVAVISGIFGQKDIREATKLLKKEILTIIEA